MTFHELQHKRGYTTMDANRFDTWTRDRALRLSRRDALRLLGAGGAAAALPTFASNVAAQSTCSFMIHAETAGGPSAPARYDGTLQFALDSDGALRQASFVPNSGTPQPATGRVAGRAIDVQIVLAPNQILVFSGAGDQPIAGCQGALGGLFSGPQAGDLGAWQATSGAHAPAAPAATPVTTSGQPTSTGNQPSGSGCQAPSFACGPNCCPSGATCSDANQGLCSCPNGTEQCGSTCVPSCSNGQSLDLDTCSCPPPEAACIQNQQVCQNHGQCCSGYCGGGTCFDCAGKVCGDFGCIDPNKDSQNCGNCGNVCISPQVCNNGACGCASDGTPCVNHNECCSQLCFASTCVSCSNVTTGGGVPLTFCGEGICVNLLTDIDHCGACFNSCPRTSGGIVCDNGVCHDINNDANYCGFAGTACPAGQICRLGDCVNP